MGPFGVHFLLESHSILLMNVSVEKKYPARQLNVITVPYVVAASMDDTTPISLVGVGGRPQSTAVQPIRTMR